VEWHITTYSGRAAFCHGDEKFSQIYVCQQNKLRLKYWLPALELRPHILCSLDLPPQGKFDGYHSCVSTAAGFATTERNLNRLHNIERRRLSPQAKTVAVTRGFMMWSPNRRTGGEQLPFVRRRTIFLF